MEYVAQAASADAHSGSGGEPGDPAPSDAGRGEPVGLGRRFLALFIDWLLCLFASAPLGGLQDNAWAAPAALVVEYAFFLGLFGQTPGMYVARIRCVGYVSGRPIGIPRAIVRGLLLVLVIPPLVMNSEQRGLHDRAAGSVIVPAVRG